MDEKIKEFLEREGLSQKDLEMEITRTRFYSYQNKRLAQLADETGLGMGNLRRHAVDLLLDKADCLEELRVDMDIRDFLEQE